MHDHKQGEWFVYILASLKRHVTYVGCTTDITRRLRQHNGEIKGGARSTRAGRPWTVSSVSCQLNHSSALKLEATVKRLSHQERISKKLELHEVDRTVE